MFTNSNEKIRQLADFGFQNSSLSLRFTEE